VTSPAGDWPGLTAAARLLDEDPERLRDALDAVIHAYTVPPTFTLDLAHRRYEARPHADGTPGYASAPAATP
jgi:hypothetical protein